MKQYFTLGLNIFFEKDLEDNIFSYSFKNGELQTRFSVSENVMLLAEQTNKFEYEKRLNKRVLYFGKKFK